MCFFIYLFTLQFWKDQIWGGTISNIANDPILYEEDLFLIRKVARSDSTYVSSLLNDFELQHSIGKLNELSFYSKPNKSWYYNLFYIVEIFIFCICKWFEIICYQTITYPSRAAILTFFKKNDKTHCFIFFILCG